VINQDGILWETIRSMLYYIFRNSEIETKIITQEQLRIIREFHETPLGGHQDINRTFQRILQQHHWKGMRQMIKTYILSCEICQRNKITN